jgi:hypothetical protein
MKHTTEFLKELYSEQLKITNGAKGDTIHQTQRNSVKARFMDAIQKDLVETLNVDALRTADGIGIMLDNEEQGGVPCVLDIAMKSFDYDIYKEHDAYQVDQEIKAEKAAARAKARRTKFKNDTAARELKEKRK